MCTFIRCYREKFKENNRARRDSFRSRPAVLNQDACARLARDGKCTQTGKFVAVDSSLATTHSKTRKRKPSAANYWYMMLGPGSLYHNVCRLLTRMTDMVR